MLYGTSGLVGCIQGQGNDAEPISEVSFMQSFIVLTVNVLTELQTNAISGFLSGTSGQLDGILCQGNDAESISEVSFMLSFIVWTVNV